MHTVPPPAPLPPQPTVTRALSLRGGGPPVAVKWSAEREPPLAEMSSESSGGELTRDLEAELRCDETLSDGVDAMRQDDADCRQGHLSRSSTPSWPASLQGDADQYATLIWRDECYYPIPIDEERLQAWYVILQTAYAAELRNIFVLAQITRTPGAGTLFTKIFRKLKESALEGGRYGGGDEQRFRGFLRHLGRRTKVGADGLTCIPDGDHDGREHGGILTSLALYAMWVHAKGYLRNAAQLSHEDCVAPTPPSPPPMPDEYHRGEDMTSTFMRGKVFFSVRNGGFNAWTLRTHRSCSKEARMCAEARQRALPYAECLWGMPAEPWRPTYEAWANPRRLGSEEGMETVCTLPSEVWQLRGTDERRYGMTGGCVLMRSMESISDCWVDVVHASRLNYPVFGWLPATGHGLLEEPPVGIQTSEEVGEVAGTTAASAPANRRIDLEAISRAAGAAAKEAASTYGPAGRRVQLTIDMESVNDSGSRPVCLRASTTTSSIGNPQVVLETTRCASGHSAGERKPEMTSDGELKQLACATYPGVSLVMTLEQRPAPTSASPTYSPTYSPPLSPSYSPPLSPAESLALSPKIATTAEEMVAVANEGAPLSGAKRTHVVYDEPSTPPLTTAPDGVVDRQSPGDGTDLQERCSHVTPPTTRDSVGSNGPY